MMVVDTSALLAIFFLEAEAEAFTRAIRDAEAPLLSAANLVETSIVLDSRVAGSSAEELDAFIAGSGLEVEPVTSAQAQIARDAYRAYGKGIHPAGLNFGDCFAYALAKAAGLPLLYKGRDFPKTDVKPWT
ncbi:MAG: type II toxin-antitoxin system VapC family toxin [Rhodospirillales bacterium]|nr:type II toxin-antitoxin system VapC family toxin [Rhodospirillales bacterium]